MEREVDAVGRGRRTTIVLASLAALLGLWYLSDDEVGVGIGWLVFAALNALTLVSRRVAAFVYAPIFRRKRPHGAG